MQLVVTMNDGDADLEPLELTIGTFKDQDKFAGRVARTVKRWLRTVPVRQTPSRLDIRLLAAWQQDVVRIALPTAEKIVERHMPKRKRKASK